MTAVWPSSLATVFVGCAPTDSQYCTRLMSSPMCLLPSLPAECILYKLCSALTSGSDQVRRLVCSRACQHVGLYAQWRRSVCQYELLHAIHGRAQILADKPHLAQGRSGQGSQCVSRPWGIVSPQQICDRREGSAGQQVFLSASADDQDVASPTAARTVLTFRPNLASLNLTGMPG